MKRFLTTIAAALLLMPLSAHAQLTGDWSADYPLDETFAAGDVFTYQIAGPAQRYATYGGLEGAIRAVLDGENITNDTIDDDSIDFVDITLADFTNDAGLLSNVVEDTAPALGGNLDLGAFQLYANGTFTLESDADSTGLEAISFLQAGSSLLEIDSSGSDTTLSTTTAATDLILSGSTTGEVRVADDLTVTGTSTFATLDVTGALTTGSLTATTFDADSLTLDDGGANVVGLDLDGDRIYHDTDNDGTKDPGEFYIDNGYEEVAIDLSANDTIDWSLGDAFYNASGATEAGTSDITFSNDDTGLYQVITVRVVAGATPVLDWLSVDEWPSNGGTAPTHPANETHTYTFTSVNGFVSGFSSIPSGSGIAPAYGSIYWATPALTANATATPIKAAGTTAAQGTANLMTQGTANRLTYTGTVSRDFKVTASVSLDASAATLGSIFIAKNGTEIAATEVQRQIPNTDIGAMAVEGIVTLTENDYVELWCETDDGDDLTVEFAVLSAVSIQGQSTGVGTGVYRTVYIDAAAMVPRTTAGATAATEEYATNDIMSDHLLFDGASTEGVQFRANMPDEWDLGTVKIKLHWDAASGATAADLVSFDVAAGAISNDDAIDAALGTAVEVDDVVIAVGDLHTTPASAALTVGGTPALGDLIWFQIERDHDDAADDMTEDLKLLGATIQYKESTTEPSAW